MREGLCSICFEPIAGNARDPRWLKGNNAAPVNDGKCCDRCNVVIVIPARYRLACMDYAEAHNRAALGGATEKTK